MWLCPNKTLIHSFKCQSFAYISVPDLESQHGRAPLILYHMLKASFRVILCKQCSWTREQEALVLEGQQSTCNNVHSRIYKNIFKVNICVLCEYIHISISKYPCVYVCVCVVINRITSSSENCRIFFLCY